MIFTKGKQGMLLAIWVINFMRFELGETEFYILFCQTKAQQIRL